MDMSKIKEKMIFFIFFWLLRISNLKGGKVVLGMLGFEMCVFKSVVDCKL